MLSLSYFLLEIVVCIVFINNYCILADNIKIITFRLLPEMDLKVELLKVVKKIR